MDVLLLLTVLCCFGCFKKVSALTTTDAANCLSGTACSSTALPTCNAGRRYCTGAEVSNALVAGLNAILLGGCCYIQDNNQLASTCSQLSAYATACRQCLGCPPLPVKAPPPPQAQQKPKCVKFNLVGRYAYQTGDCHDCCSNGCDNCACSANSGSCTGKQDAINAACAEFSARQEAVNNVQSFTNLFSNSQELQGSGAGGPGFGQGAAKFAKASSGASTTVYDGHTNIILGDCTEYGSTFTCHTNDNRRCFAGVCSSSGRTGSRSIQVAVQYTIFDPTTCAA